MTKGRAILLATLVAGTLDILAAIVQAGGAAGTVLRSVAAGPLGDGAASGGAGMAVGGLVIHFLLMAVIAAVFVLAAARLPMLRRPLIWGPLYGLAVWGVMYLIVLPLRWPGAFPLTDPVRIAWAIAFHTLLVGLPIALIAARQGAGGQPKGVLAS